MAEVKGHTPANVIRPTLRHKSKQHNPVLKSDDKYGNIASICNKLDQKKDLHQPRPPDNEIEKSNRLSAQRHNINDHLLLTENKDLKIDQLWKPPWNRCNSRSRSNINQNWMYHKENPGPRAF